MQCQGNRVRRTQAYAVEGKTQKCTRRRGKKLSPDSEGTAAPADSLAVHIPALANPKAFTPGRLQTYRALVLDSAYRPIRVVNWQRAVRLFA
jgi:hypothetical protein